MHHAGAEELEACPAVHGGLIILMRLICPSAGLVVQGMLSAASTAVMSFRSSVTKPESWGFSAAAGTSAKGSSLFWRFPRVRRSVP